ncbi:unnamed protein product [Ilex paraguariensis]|uniref:Uncharacterized protein n=1 Tax=Ilex paraguariensis TaxID=185542 RepID=A0ABC8UQU8_9AQUA
MMAPINKNYVDMDEYAVTTELQASISSPVLSSLATGSAELGVVLTTWLEPECDKLMMAPINKNYVDMDEYAVTTELQASISSPVLSSLATGSVN